MLETRKIVPGDAIQYLHHGRRVEGEVQKDGSIKGAGRKGDYYIDPVAFAREDNKWASTDNQSEIRLLFADCSKLGDDDKEQSLEELLSSCEGGRGGGGSSGGGEGTGGKRKSTAVPRE